LDANFWIFVVEAIPLAILIGIASATIGYTAWSIVVPLLFVGFGFDVFDALFVSVCTDFIDTAILTFRYAKRKKVNFRLGMIYGLPGLVAAIIGYSLTTTLLYSNQNMLRGGIAYIFLIFGTIFIFRAKNLKKKSMAGSYPSNGLKPSISDKNREEIIGSSISANQITSIDAPSYVTTHVPTQEMQDSPKKKAFQISEKIGKLIMVIGIAATGFFSGLVGIGGGSNFTLLFLFVLGSKYGFDTLKSTGTGCFVMLLITGTLTFCFGWLANILNVFPYLAVISICAIVGTVIGLKIAFKVKEYTLNYIIAAAIITASIVSSVQSIFLA
jgi:uncharacterized membrane protein YfcA